MCGRLRVGKSFLHVCSIGRCSHVYAVHMTAGRRWPTRLAPAQRPCNRFHALIERHVLAAERLHGDDTTVPILAKGKTVTGRIWTYVRDDRPFGGHAPPAALYYASRDRKHEHPVQHQAFTGILQADAYSGYNEFYDPSRSQGAITAALCWAHARRQFFELADIAANARRGKNAAAISPVALAAVKRIDALFDIERDINGLSAEERLRVRQEQRARPFWLLSPSRSITRASTSPHNSSK